ncbi:MAG: TIGR03557 family F420-dependent LLM class oxidoreductase [Actinophytocola sp.]|nr:TIGR03557 family F420-dependent LLM class oxidoreductase [Actinophytocola sp.]
MVSMGYFLSCEEFGPRELVRQARLAEHAGFERLWISDHYHPWTGEQGNSPFVWSVIGALSEATSLPITTAVTCPTVRIHPAVIAQAAATAAVQTGGKFALGVGSGEALNEHILGDRWPPTPERLDMLDEAIDVIRKLFTGEQVTHRGAHYTVDNARLYTLPDEPPPIHVSGFGPKAARRAGETGDGFCIVMPDADLIQRFRDSGGRDKPVQAGLKVCLADTEEDGVDTAHRLWPTETLPGELGQTLPRPSDFEHATSLVIRDMVRDSFPCGPDLDQQIAAVTEFVDAGADEVYVQQIGPEQDAFFKAWQQEVLPALRS